jgi:hypothetical protein
MSAEDVLRLAWQADRDGRNRMRDELLMLAVAESGLDDAVSAERCRKLLVAGRPDHWFTSFATIGQALGHPRVATEIDRLRVTYPPARIQQILLRFEAQRGPYTDKPRPLSKILDDLGGTRVPAAPSHGRVVSPALPFPAGNPSGAKAERPDDPATLVNFYLTVLMAIAILLASVQPPVAQDTRAA